MEMSEADLGQEQMQAASERLGKKKGIDVSGLGYNLQTRIVFIDLVITVDCPTRLAAIPPADPGFGQIDS